MPNITFRKPTHPETHTRSRRITDAAARETREMSTARSTQYISYNSLVIRVQQPQQQQTHKYVVFAWLCRMCL